MKEIIEELEIVKSQLINLFEKNEDVEHIHFLVGDCVLVVTDRIDECKSILKNGVIWRDKFGEIRKNQSLPKLAPADHFYRQD